MLKSTFQTLFIQPALATMATDLSVPARTKFFVLLIQEQEKLLR